MRRRDFVMRLGGAVLAWPLAVRAQQPDRMYRIGVLIPFAESDVVAQIEVSAFREQLQQLGWTDGRNLRSDYRWAAGDIGKIRTFAKELVALRPDVILARTTPVTAALLRETRTIPIVFVVVSDPVGDGFVTSLARPGGNVTGFTNFESSLGGKWLGLLKEIFPRVARVAFMFGPKAAPGGGSYFQRSLVDTAPSIPVELVAMAVPDAAEIERAIVAFTHEPNGGLLVLPDVTTLFHRDLIISLAARHRLPGIYPWSDATIAGGLISYGINYVELYRRAASYVDRILRGAKPGELPVQAPVKFDLIINATTARALGLTIPQSILIVADRVIE